MGGVICWTKEAEGVLVQHQMSRSVQLEQSWEDLLLQLQPDDPGEQKQRNKSSE